METAELIQKDFSIAENILIKQVEDILKKEPTKEDVNAINVLRKNGFQSFKQSRELLKNDILKSEKIALEEFRPFFEKYKMLTQTSLNYILEKYNLIIDEPKRFTSEIPLEASKYILSFNKVADKINRAFDYYIVAPKEMFNPKLEVNLDPVILSNIRNTSVYIVVYAWGVEKNILNIEEI